VFVLTNVRSLDQVIVNVRSVESSPHMVIPAPAKGACLHFGSCAVCSCAQTVHLADILPTVPFLLILWGCSGAVRAIMHFGGFLMEPLAPNKCRLSFMVSLFTSLLIFVLIVCISLVLACRSMWIRRWRSLTGC
jgi:hypothetical protein